MLKERARILAVTIFVLDLSLVAARFPGGLLDSRFLFSLVVAPPRLSESSLPLGDYLPPAAVRPDHLGRHAVLSGRYPLARTVPLLDEAWAIRPRLRHGCGRSSR